jgi:hypothetical protein
MEICRGSDLLSEGDVFRRQGQRLLVSNNMLGSGNTKRPGLIRHRADKFTLNRRPIGYILANLLSAGSGCRKSRLALMIKNSAGYGRGLRRLNT